MAVVPQAVGAHIPPVSRQVDAMENLATTFHGTRARALNRRLGVTVLDARAQRGLIVPTVAWG